MLVYRSPGGLPRANGITTQDDKENSFMKKSLLLIPILAALAVPSAFGKGSGKSDKDRVLARINGAAFTEADLEVRLGMLPDARREEILADTQLRRQEFENFLKNRLYALAGQKSRHGKSAELRQRADSRDQRVITQYYFETYLRNHGGFTRAQIEAFYHEDPSRFKDDSGRVLSLAKAFPRVVDSLILKGVDVDSAYQANKADYSHRPWAEVSLIRTKTRKEADAALAALKKGTKFAAVAAKFSKHEATKNNGGRYGRVNPGDAIPDLGSPALIDSLLFSEKTRLQAGRHSGVYAWNDGFVILSLDAYHPEFTPPLEDVRTRVLEDILRAKRAVDADPVIERLKEKHGLRLVSLDREPTEKELLAYYEKHKNDYISPETYELYHIEAADSATLAQAVADVSTLEQFKAAAAKASANELTRAQQGRLGTVKRDFVLPYGVGTLPALFPLLDEMESGKVKDLVENPSTQKWHAFWLERKHPQAPKAFDRVRPTVVKDFKANSIASVKPGDVLAEIGKKHVIREADVLALRKEIPEQMQERYPRESLVNFIAVWRIVSDEALSLGLDRDLGLRAARLANQDAFWGEIYRDSILPASWEDSPKELEKAFKADRAVFVRDSSAATWKDHVRDVAAWRLLTPKELEIEYHTNPERYTRDSALIPFAQARPQIFDALRQSAHTRLDEAVLAKLKARYKVRLEDPALGEPSLEPTSATYQKAQDLHYDRKLDQAMRLYNQLRAKYPDRAGLQDSVSFGIAQIYLEQERYQQAMAEYRRVSYLYPDSPNDYKAMFMVGFIQAEHLRQDSAAVRSFEAMLKKYPDSDLSDDADWMIRNIRSGGKLMPTLEDDESEEGDAAAAE